MARPMLQRLLAGVSLAACCTRGGALSEQSSAFNCPPITYQDKAIAVELADGRVFIPAYRHEPALGKHPTTAIIALHGAGRDGDSYFGWVTSAMNNHGSQDETVVLVPMFADQDCEAEVWSGNEKYTAEGIKWSHSTRQWVFGQRSDKSGDWQGISSYQVIDDLVQYVELHYKHLQKIVVTGFSAGAQMGLRWSIFSPQGTQGTTLSGIPLTIVLGSPSSVTYLSKSRPAVSCTLSWDNNMDHNCTDFQDPEDDDNRLKTCGGKWDLYAFGIEGLDWDNTKPGTLRGDVADYLHKYIKDDNLLAQTLKDRFASKDLVFQFGDEDTKDCRRGECADDCAAMLEGNTRLQRGLNYMWYLKWALPGYTPEYSVFHGGHRPELFFAGEYFNLKAFNAGGWDECLWDSLECLSLLVKALSGGVLLLSLSSGACVFLCMKAHRDKHYIKLHHERAADVEAARKLLKVRK